MLTFDSKTQPKPDIAALDWQSYRKTAHIKATKIEGPFRVVTSEGTLTCQDGYLCIDSRGYYYPVATEEFDNIYVRAEG